MGGFGHVAVAVTVMTVMVALAGGCGESKKEREARESQERYEAMVRQQMEEQNRLIAERQGREKEAETLAAVKAAQVPYTGWFTEDQSKKTFKISTTKQLEGLAQLVNWGENFAGKTITLTADINLSAYGKGAEFNDGKGWVPINGFAGTFDGAGKKISGLYINDNTLDKVGLFGSVNGGTIKNLGVENVNIIGGDWVGGVAGVLGQDCHIGEDGEESCGVMDANIVNCYSTGTVSGKNIVGGVVGRNSGGKISDTYSTAAVNGHEYVGGIVGDIWHSGNVSSSYATGNVKGSNNVGGVVGLLVGGDMNDCGNVSNSYSTGAVSGKEKVGGVVGGVGSECNVSNSYSTGAVSGTKSVGGVVGWADQHYSRVRNSVALNPSVKSNAAAGRVVGEIASGGIVENNAAFAGLKDRGDRTDRWVVKGDATGDGEDITAEEIATDGTLGARFHGKPWITENGKLPVLRGKPANIPAHLRQ